MVLAGEVIDLPRPEPGKYPGNLVDRLEAADVVVRVNEEDYDDTVENRYGEMANCESRIRDVLVFTPVYRLESETVESVLALEWDHAITWVFQRDNPVRIVGDLNKSGEVRKAGINNHLHQYRRGRETFLQGRYDAMLVVESDMIVPRDALIRLAAVMDGRDSAGEDQPGLRSKEWSLAGQVGHARPPVDVAYGVYRFRKSDVINVFELYPSKDGILPRNIGESLSVHPHLLKRAMKLGVYPCSGAGFGCTLIRRNVLERLEFRINERNSAHCDTYFCTDVLRAGFRQAAEMRVVCGHVDEDGRILWPDLGQELRVGNQGLGIRN